MSGSKSCLVTARLKPDLIEVRCSGARMSAPGKKKRRSAALEFE